jgi:predicted anti-sigma-YlaC factor YlaD
MDVMSECEKLLELIIGCDPVDDAHLQRHAAQCSHCREQLEAERELRHLFQGIPRPGPSLHFNRKLGKRLRAERERQRRHRWRLYAMQGYWVAASLASMIVMLLIRWPSELPSVPAMVSLGAVFGVALLAPLILFMSLRVSPLGLILGTMDEFRR